jgi:two-component system CheB/CheR fusion protein
MKNDKIDPKILRSNYIPTAEFYSQVIDSLQDYSILLLIMIL